MRIFGCYLSNFFIIHGFEWQTFELDRFSVSYQYKCKGGGIIRVKTAELQNLNARKFR